MTSRDLASPEVATFVPDDPHPAPSLARAFDPFRTVKEPAALALIEEVIDQIQSYEVANGLRQRARKARDLENFQRTVSAILVDLMNADALGHAHGLHLSRRKAELTGRCRYRARFIGEGLPAILDAMTTLGMIVQEKGAYGAGRTQTIIRASKALEARFQILGLDLHAFGEAIDRETVELRDRKSRPNVPADRLDYQDTVDTAGWRSDMLAINRHLADAWLDVDPALLKNPDQPVDTSRRFLRRIFHNGSFDQGGRLHGGFWQRMSKEDRFNALSIGGEPIVELDFRQIGLRIAYAHVGAIAPLGDLYAIPGYEHHRKGVKAVIVDLR